ncbi:MAG: acetate--CoA ligase family protein [Rhodobacteraceae bacterium]|nr:acetate--CoA ligase family protein [Paracoccaceae bacterium]
MDQPSVSMNMMLQAPEVMLEETAAQVFEETFKIAEDDRPKLLKAAKFEMPPELESFLRLGCAMARHLMQKSGLPVFETEVVLHCAPTAGNVSIFDVQMRVPSVIGVSNALVAAAYGQAFSLMGFFVTPTFDPVEFRAETYAASENLIQPIRRQLAAGLSTIPVFNEAFERDVPTLFLTKGLFQLGTGIHGRIVSKSATDRDSALGAVISADKKLTHELLASVGAPVADLLSVNSAESAAQAAAQLGFPVVVKPADQDRGIGISLDLETEDAVRAAYAAARKVSSKILVQRRIPGHCNRLVVFQGEFVFGYTRNPPGVTGDGTSTVRDLVDAFNTEHSKLAQHMDSKPIPFDDEALACLQDQGVEPEDVLENEQTVFLREANLPDFAGVNVIVTDEVHPENKALAERLARLLRLESVGLDLISPDPSVPWYENNGAITELNFKPQIGENTARRNLEAMFPDEAEASVKIECMVGGPAALRAGKRRHASLRSEGTKAFLASHEVTLDADGSVLRTHGLNGLYQRAVALLQNPEAEVVILVVQTDELLQSGPPFRGNVTVTPIDDGVVSANGGEKALPKAAVERLKKALMGY